MYIPPHGYLTLQINEIRIEELNSIKKIINPIKKAKFDSINLKLYTNIKSYDEVMISFAFKSSNIDTIQYISNYFIINNDTFAATLNSITRHSFSYINDDCTVQLLNKITNEFDNFFNFCNLIIDRKYDIVSDNKLNLFRKKLTNLIQLYSDDNRWITLNGFKIRWTYSKSSAKIDPYVLDSVRFEFNFRFIELRVFYINAQHLIYHLFNNKIDTLISNKQFKLIKSI